MHQVADHCQVLFHNFTPATAARLGVDRQGLLKRHPDLLVGSVTGFDPTGPDADRPAYDLIIQALSGLMYVTGEAGGPATRVGVAVVDLIAGLQAALGVLATLVDRGVARSVNVSLADAGVSSLTNVLANFLASGVEPGRHGTAHSNIVPYQVFAAEDGYLAIAVGNDSQFKGLCDLLELDPDGQFATNEGRLRGREQLLSVINEQVKRRQRDDLVDALTARGVPAGAVNHVGDAVKWLQRSSAGGWTQTLGGITMAPDPISIDGQRLPVRYPPPKLGADTRQVLSQAGLTDQEVTGLLQRGVVA
jgi:crotonobetainyl-CoA:carnitine CoA-transferase CaiB-like acyl-CoA transferase